MELINLRNENTKTFDIGNGQRQLVASIGAVHYKDNYVTDKEWKDIDLAWVDNKITKAPYELTLEGKKITIRDKKSGEVSVIELTDIGGKPIHSPSDMAWLKSKGLARAPGIINLDNVALDTDLEIVAENGAVRFTRVLKSDKAPKDASFKVTGNWQVKALDADGELPVESTLVDGILTETLKPDRAVKYPVRIDPTWQVGASTDDCLFRPGANVIALISSSFQVGNNGVGFEDFGTAARFLNVNIPAGATIVTAVLIVTARSDQTVVTVNSRIRAELNVAPATFSTAGDFTARTWTSDATHVHWNAIGGWTADTECTSPDIKVPIQEVANLGAIIHLVVLWDDFEKLSTQVTGTKREGYSYNGSTTKAHKLTITYTEPSTNITITLTDVMVANSADTTPASTIQADLAVTMASIGNAVSPIGIVSAIVPSAMASTGNFTEPTLSLSSVMQLLSAMLASGLISEPTLVSISKSLRYGISIPSETIILTTKPPGSGRYG